MVEASKATVIDAKNAAVIDDLGRSIKVKKLSALDRMRIYTVAGPQNSENSRFMDYAFLAASVTLIDDMPYGLPTSLLQIEFLVEKLDEAGLAAVIKGIVAISPADEDLAAAAKNL